MPPTPTPIADPHWPEAIATVLTCRYDMRAGRALLGVPSGKHYHITYNYFANDAFHTADFYSDRPIPQNTLFPIRYNPDTPADHTPDPSSGEPATPPNPVPAILILGLLGSLILSLAWFALLRGCH